VLVANIDGVGNVYKTVGGVSYCLLQRQIMTERMQAELRYLIYLNWMEGWMNEQDWEWE
jgi:hypothetical protein